MLIDDIRNNFKDDVVSAIDSLLHKSALCFEPLCGLSDEKQLEVLDAARSLYRDREHVKICDICHHSELLVDEWMNSRLCVQCYNKRGNRGRADDILRGR